MLLLPVSKSHITCLHESDRVVHLTLEDAVGSYPLKCLEALATRLGLHHHEICAEIERLQEHGDQTAAQPSKCRHTDGIGGLFLMPLVSLIELSLSRSLLLDSKLTLSRYDY